MESRVTHRATCEPSKTFFTELEDRDSAVSAEGGDLSSQMSDGVIYGISDVVIGAKDAGGEFRGLNMETSASVRDGQKGSGVVISGARFRKIRKNLMQYFLGHVRNGSIVGYRGRRV